MKTEYRPIEEVFSHSNQDFIGYGLSDKIHDIMMQFKGSMYRNECIFWQCNGIYLEPSWIKWIIRGFVDVINEYKKDTEFVFRAPDELIDVKVRIKKGKAEIKYSRNLSLKEIDNYDDYQDLITKFLNRMRERYNMFFRLVISKRDMYALLTAILITYFKYIIINMEEGDVFK